MNNINYSYKEVIIWLEKKGVERYGNHFKIFENDHPTVFKLIAYFLKDEPVCDQFNINTNKGILLSGPVGCGKTALMNVMKSLNPSENKFYIKPCRDISFEFIQEGYEIIHKYSKGKLYQSDPKIICFDDLGAENNLKYFGNECNVMAEIILSRYDLFTAKKNSNPHHHQPIRWRNRKPVRQSGKKPIERIMQSNCLRQQFIRQAQIKLYA